MWNSDKIIVHFQYCLLLCTGQASAVPAKAQASYNRCFLKIKLYWKPVRGFSDTKPPPRYEMLKGVFVFGFGNFFSCCGKTVNVIGEIREGVGTWTFAFRNTQTFDVLLLRWKWYWGARPGPSPPGLCTVQNNTGQCQQPFKGNPGWGQRQSPSRGLSSVQRNVLFEMPMSDPSHKQLCENSVKFTQFLLREAVVFDVWLDGCLGEGVKFPPDTSFGAEGVNFASRLMAHAVKQNHVTSLEPEAVETIPE